jgi:hypothetical protein
VSPYQINLLFCPLCGVLLIAEFDAKTGEPLFLIEGQAACGPCWADETLQTDLPSAVRSSVEGDWGLGMNHIRMQTAAAREATLGWRREVARHVEIAEERAHHEDGGFGHE